MNNPPLDFYVYILRRPDKLDPFDKSKGSPFYVGKGKGYRAWGHEYEATVLNIDSYKCNIIRKIIRNGYNIEIDIINESLTSDDAFKLEIELINKYGRYKKGGLLANIASGGNGGWDHIDRSVIQKKLVEDGTHVFVRKDENGLSLAQRLVQDGTHHFLGKSNPQYKAAIAGTHYWQTEEFSRWMSENNPMYNKEVAMRSAESKRENGVYDRFSQIMVELNKNPTDAMISQRQDFLQLGWDNNPFLTSENPVFKMSQVLKIKNWLSLATPGKYQLDEEFNSVIGYSCVRYLIRGFERYIARSNLPNVRIEQSCLVIEGN